jgi:hypothetical protein
LYFLLLAIACAAGWSAGLWATPLIAFAVLEVVWTSAEWMADRGATLPRSSSST